MNDETCSDCQRPLHLGHHDTDAKIYCDELTIVKLRTALRDLVRAVKDYHPEACTGSVALDEAERLLKEMS